MTETASGPSASSSSAKTRLRMELTKSSHLQWNVIIHGLMEAQGWHSLVVLEGAGKHSIKLLMRQRRPTTQLRNQGGYFQPSMSVESLLLPMAVKTAARPVFWTEAQVCSA
eukprot:3390404-Amphidinium_carterae.2